MPWRVVARFVVRWIALAITGWLAYGLLRGLSAIVWLGVPPFDWVWYATIIPLIVVPPVYLLWRLTEPRSFVVRVKSPLNLVLFGILIVAAIIGYNGFGQVVVLPLDEAKPIPIAFWTGADFTRVPDSILEDIRAAGGRVYFGAGGYYPFDGERGLTMAASLRRLADYSIDAYLATPAGDDFLSVPVYRDWITSTRRAAVFVQRHGLSNVRGFIGDAEPPFHSPMDFLGAQRAEFERAVSDLRALIESVQREYGLRIGVTSTWAQFVDTADGDADLSIVVRSPVDPPGGWDFVNLMTYSSYFPPDWRPYTVYLLERSMARLYPSGDVSYLIGLVGGGMPGEPLLDFDELVRDARLSRALGVREIAVFQLDGALRVFGDDFVRRLTAAVNSSQPGAAVAVPFSRPASLLFYATAAADALLDVRGPLGWAWIALSGMIAFRTYPKNP